MNFGFGKINGFSSAGFLISGAQQVFEKPSAKLVKNVNKSVSETPFFAKPFKPQCEFCKEKIGLLNDDVFVKESKVHK